MSPVGTIIQLVLRLGMAVGQAFVAAYHQAAANPQAMQNAVRATSSNMMSVLEARQVLNIATDAPLTKPVIIEQFKRYYTANDPEKGGSLYLQAKIYNAKAALYEEAKIEEDAEDEAVFHTVADKEAAEEEIETEKKKPE